MVNTSHSPRPATTLTTALFAGACLLAVGAAQAEEKVEQKGWESSAAAGATLTRGNSHSFNANLSFNANRKWTDDEVLLGASAGFGENRNRTTDEYNKTDRYIKGFSQWNHFFANDRLYAGIRADGLADDIANVDYRASIGPLVGYYLIKDAKTKLSGEVGPSWTIEKLTGNGPHGYVGLRAGERFEHKFDSGARVWQTVDITPKVNDFDQYVVNFELGVEAPITKALATRLVLQDTFNHQLSQKQKDDGILKNDLKLIASIAYKF